MRSALRSPHEPTGRANARPMTGSATCGTASTAGMYLRDRPRISLRSCGLHVRGKLLRRDLRVLDHLGPARTILGDQVCKALRRAALRDQALLAEQRANARLRQYLVEHRIVAIDDFFRRVGGSKNAVPQIDIEVGDAEFC